MPPKHIKIRDQSGRDVHNSTIGPYNENTNVTLVCESKGGEKVERRPCPPTLTLVITSRRHSAADVAVVQEQRHDRRQLLVRRRRRRLERAGHR